jgi:hypothetical protein
MLSCRFLVRFAEASAVRHYLSIEYGYPAARVLLRLGVVLDQPLVLPLQGCHVQSQQENLPSNIAFEAPRWKLSGHQSQSRPPPIAQRVNEMPRRRRNEPRVWRQFALGHLALIAV